MAEMSQAKREFLDSLKNIVVSTNHGIDDVSIEWAQDEDNDSLSARTVLLHLWNGSIRKVNVAWDSPAAIVLDVFEYLLRN